MFSITDLTCAFVGELERLEPCGKGNPAPLVVVEGRPRDVQIVKEKHVKFRIEGADAVWWGGADRIALLGDATAVLGVPGQNVWNGRTEIRLTVEDVA